MNAARVASRDRLLWKAMRLGPAKSPCGAAFKQSFSVSRVVMLLTASLQRTTSVPATSLSNSSSSVYNVTYRDVITPLVNGGKGAGVPQLQLLFFFDQSQCMAPSLSTRMRSCGTSRVVTSRVSSDNTAPRATRLTPPCVIATVSRSSVASHLEMRCMRSA